MKAILIYFMLFVYQISYCQNENDYIVTLNHDTIKIENAKWHWIGNNRIHCQVNGKDTLFHAEFTRAYKVGNEIGESGKVKTVLIGFKRWVFFERTIQGKISLYTINVYDADMRYTGSSKKVKVRFFRKNNDPDRVFHKSYGDLLEMYEDCPIILEKLKDHYYFMKIEDEINFYNKECGKQ